MLDVLREKKSSIAINFIIALIGVVFIFWTGSPGSGQRIRNVASVNGTQISEVQYERAVANQIEQMRRFTRGKLPKDQEATIRSRVLDQLVEGELLKQEARRLGIVVSDYELQQEILNNPALKDDNGKFDTERYKRILNRYPTFEQDERERLQLTRLEGIIRNMAQVSDADLKAMFAEQNTRVNLEYVKLSYDTFEKDIQITPEERTAFIKDHSDEIQARYDQDFERIYNSPKKVRARHILLKYETGDTPEVKAQVRAKMEEVKALTASGDFAALATEYSEDAGSTTKGGDLGFFDDKRMDPAFTQVAFSTPVGSISDIVETRFGLHIIKVEEIQEAQVKTVEMVRDEIADTLIKAQKAPELARKAAEGLAAAWKAQSPELDEKLKAANLSRQETTPTTKTGDSIRGIGTSEQLAQAAFTLSAANPIPESFFTVGDAFVFIRLKERQEADMSTFAAQKDTLKAQVQRDKQTQFFDAWKADLKARAKIQLDAQTEPARS